MTLSYLRRDSVVSQMWDMTRPYVKNMWDMTHSYVRRDSVVRHMWDMNLSHMWDMTHSYVKNICEALLSRQSYVRRAHCAHTHTHTHTHTGTNTHTHAHTHIFLRRIQGQQGRQEHRHTHTHTHTHTHVSRMTESCLTFDPQVDDITAPFADDNAGGKIGPTLAAHNKLLPAAFTHGHSSAGTVEEAEEEQVCGWEGERESEGESVCVCVWLQSIVVGSLDAQTRHLLGLWTGARRSRCVSEREAERAKKGEKDQNILFPGAFMHWHSSARPAGEADEF